MLKLIETTKVSESDSEWELPAPLGQFNLPIFPLEAFPRQLCVLCAFCEAVAESYQVPADLPAMLVLSVGGASLAKRIVVHVRGDHWEPVNLFTVVALPPANRKSGVFRAVTEPLTYFERQEVERLAPEVEKNRNQRIILEESLKHAQKQAAKAKKVSVFTKREAFNALRGSIQKVDELEKPLEILINHGYIREVSQERQGPGRKPSPKYKINPLWLAQNTQNTHNSNPQGNSAYSAQFAQEITI